MGMLMLQDKEVDSQSESGEDEVVFSGPSASAGPASSSAAGPSIKPASVSMRESDMRKQIRLPNGAYIRYFSRPNAKSIIEVHCNNKDHGKCVKTLQMESHEDEVNFPATGRCLGKASAWGTCTDDFATHVEHMEFNPSPALRKIARVSMRVAVGPEFVELEQFERQRRLGEGSEPEGDP
jgi:hypothetical protein